LQTTSNYGLKKPDGTDTVDIADLNYNADQIDSALTPTADPAQEPTGNGPGKLVQWVGWLINRIKAITGKANWWDAPTKSMEQINTDLAAHLADGTIGAHEAKNIALEDTGSHFVSSEVEGALSELFTSVSDGKTQVASAVTDMGQAAAGSDTHAALATKIRDISDDATAAVGEVLTTKTFYQGGSKKTGTMPSRGAVTLTPSTVDQAIAAGYHNGAGKVVGDADLVAANIKSTANIFNVAGTCHGAAAGPSESALFTGHPDNHLISSLTYRRMTELGSITAQVNGAIRIKTMLHLNDSGRDAWLRIRKNGAEV